MFANLLLEGEDFNILEDKEVQTGDDLYRELETWCCPSCFFLITVNVQGREKTNSKRETILQQKMWRESRIRSHYLPSFSKKTLQFVVRISTIYSHTYRHAIYMLPIIYVIILSSQKGII